MVELLKTVFFYPFLKLYTKVFDLCLEYDIQKRLYTYKDFEKADLYLLNLYKNQSPYKLAKQFAKDSLAANIYTYGSSPLQLYEKIKQLWIQDEKKTFLELGSGTSRGLLYLYFFSNCSVSGIEWNPYFFKYAKKAFHLFELKQINLIQKDFLLHSNYFYDYIYFFDLFIKNELLEKLIDKIFIHSFPHTKVITVSFPLSDFDGRFIVEKSFLFRFNWGRTTLFLNGKKENLWQK